MKSAPETSQIWKGKFSYDPIEYGIIDDVNFELYVELKNGSFEGVSYDDEFRELCDELAKVKGFIEDEHISFVVTYPISYSIDENDVVSIDPSKKGHDVIYDGNFIGNLGKWAGTWEILAEKVKMGKDEYFQHYSTGHWEMTM